LLIDWQEENTTSDELITNSYEKIKIKNCEEYYGSNSMGYKFKTRIIYSWVFSKILRNFGV
jgi:hypothetical protein